jgi:hypothetical protein
MKKSRQVSDMSSFYYNFPYFIYLFNLKKADSANTKSESVANESMKSESFAQLSSRTDLLWKHLNQEDVDKLQRSSSNEMEK